MSMYYSGLEPRQIFVLPLKSSGTNIVYWTDDNQINPLATINVLTNLVFDDNELNIMLDRSTLNNLNTDADICTLNSGLTLILELYQRHKNPNIGGRIYKRFYYINNITHYNNGQYRINAVRDWYYDYVYNLFNNENPRLGENRIYLDFTYLGLTTGTLTAERGDMFFNELNSPYNDYAGTERGLFAIIYFNRIIQNNEGDFNFCIIPFNRVFTGFFSWYGFVDYIINNNSVFEGAITNMTIAYLDSYVSTYTLNATTVINWLKSGYGVNDIQITQPNKILGGIYVKPIKTPTNYRIPITRTVYDSYYYGGEMLDIPINITNFFIEETHTPEASNVAVYINNVGTSSGIDTVLDLKTVNLKIYLPIDFESQKLAEDRFYKTKEIFSNVTAGFKTLISAGETAGKAMLGDYKGAMSSGGATIGGMVDIAQNILFQSLERANRAEKFSILPASGDFRLFYNDSVEGWRNINSLIWYRRYYMRSETYNGFYIFDDTRRVLVYNDEQFLQIVNFFKNRPDLKFKIVLRQPVAPARTQSTDLLDNYTQIVNKPIIIQYF